MTATTTSTSTPEVLDAYDFYEVLASIVARASRIGCAAIAAHHMASPAGDARLLEVLECTVIGLDEAQMHVDRVRHARHALPFEYAGLPAVTGAEWLPDSAPDSVRAAIREFLRDGPRYQRRR